MKILYRQYFVFHINKLQLFLMRFLKPNFHIIYAISSRHRYIFPTQSMLCFSKRKYFSVASYYLCICVYLNKHYYTVTQLLHLQRTYDGLICVRTDIPFQKQFFEVKWILQLLRMSVEL